eukprot:TRINITY_DN11704_c0_g2_i1.p1 TRINITY_DN11704_c0_g2~~TRINITY_DN11704_c0_g2_i1.p1  ORF type:complete len:1119 (+),score=416.21 TRINITY_DN11704_c0_g2_i1:80-3436(+)
MSCSETPSRGLSTLTLLTEDDDGLRDLQDELTQATLLLLKDQRQNRPVLRGYETLEKLAEQGGAAVKGDAGGIDAGVLDGLDAAVVAAQKAIESVRPTYAQHKAVYERYEALPVAEGEVKRPFDEYMRTQVAQVRGVRGGRTRDGEMARLRADLRAKDAELIALQRDNEKLQQAIHKKESDDAQRSSFTAAETAVERYNLLMKSAAETSLKEQLLELTAEVARLREANQHKDAEKGNVEERLARITRDLESAEQEREQVKSQMRDTAARNVMSKFSALVAKSKLKTLQESPAASPAATSPRTSPRGMLDAPGSADSEGHHGRRRGLSMAIVGKFKEAAQKAQIKNLREEVQAKEEERKQLVKRQEKEIYGLETKLELSCSELSAAKAAVRLFLDSLREHIKRQRIAIEEIRKALKFATDDIDSCVEQGYDALEEIDAECGAHKQQLERMEKMYLREKGLRRQYFRALQGMSGALNVVVRIKPLTKNAAKLQGSALPETTDAEPCLVPNRGDRGDEDGCTLTHTKHNQNQYKGAVQRVRKYNFNKLLDAAATQADVFREAEPLVRSLPYIPANLCLLAVGAKGSGKTHLLQGPPRSDCASNEEAEASRGVYYRTAQALLDEARVRSDTVESTVSLSVMQTEGDTITDLLAPVSSAEAAPVNLGRDRKQNLQKTIEHCTRARIADLDAALRYCEHALKRRSGGAAANLITTFHVYFTDRASGNKQTALVRLVDVAGSDGSGSAEALAVQQELGELGRVLSLKKAGETLVKSRGSLLTQILHETLKEGAKVVLYATADSNPAAYETTKSTLNLVNGAMRAHLGLVEDGAVRNMAVANHNPQRNSPTNNSLPGRIGTRRTPQHAAQSTPGQSSLVPATRRRSLTPRADGESGLCLSPAKRVSSPPGLSLSGASPETVRLDKSGRSFGALEQFRLSRSVGSLDKFIPLHEPPSSPRRQEAPGLPRKSPARKKKDEPACPTGTRTAPIAASLLAGVPSVARREPAAAAAGEAPPQQRSTSTGKWHPPSKKTPKSSRTAAFARPGGRSTSPLHLRSSSPTRTMSHDQLLSNTRGEPGPARRTTSLERSTSASRRQMSPGRAPRHGGNSPPQPSRKGVPMAMLQRR